MRDPAVSRIVFLGFFLTITSFIATVQSHVEMQSSFYLLFNIALQGLDSKILLKLIKLEKQSQKCHFEIFCSDIASLDKFGYCKIEGRIKDMIIRGGENIYPAEIEQFLHTHPKVLEAQVT